MARSSNIRLAGGLDQVGKTNSLMGAALRLLTDEVAGNESPLKTSLETLVHVLDPVNQQPISKESGTHEPASSTGCSRFLSGHFPSCGCPRRYPNHLHHPTQKLVPIRTSPAEHLGYVKPRRGCGGTGL